MSILDLLGGLLLTCIFVIFLVVLLKIIRAVMIVGIKNEELNTKEGKDDLDDNNEGKGSSIPGISDPAYWRNANPTEAYDLPSPARLSYSMEKPIILRANNIGVFGKEGLRILWFWCKPEETHKINDDNDPILFKLHYFDLMNFEPSEKDKVRPHWERAKSYVVLECASGGFVCSGDLSIDYPTYYLYVTSEAPAVADTIYTDDRFFSVHEHLAKDGVKHLYLRHLSSNYLVSTKEGGVDPIPFLKTSNTPSEVELFFFENRPADKSVAREGEERKKIN